VRLADVDAQLRSSEICAGLEEALSSLIGPIKNLRAQRLELEAEWAAVFEEASAAVEGVPDAGLWLDELRSSGLVRRLARGRPPAARSLFRSAVAAVRSLPANAVPIAEFAARLTGDAHALDPGAPVGTLVLRFAAFRGAVEDLDDVEQRREAWAVVGVLLDELSAPVLVLNLRAVIGDATARAMALHADEGEPYRLSLRQLVRSRPAFTRAATGPRVYVCENPTIVAAVANRLGARSAPLVCVEGNPRAAPRLLLHRLREHGIELLYHGDFDWAGIQIGNRVIRRFGATPWRFGCAEYGGRAAAGPLLEGEPVEPVWDGTLRAAMLTTGVLER
jgi:uncharacterized protein (TIGR02679 family)